MIRLLAFDLDGTLLDDNKNVPDSAILALRQAEKQGVQIALCSGRNHADAKYIASQIGIKAWSITTNGAYIGHSEQRHPLRTQPLDVKKVGNILKISYEFDAVPCVYTHFAEYNDIACQDIIATAASNGQHILHNPDKQTFLITPRMQWHQVIYTAEMFLMKCIVFLTNQAAFPAYKAALEAEGGLSVTTSTMFSGVTSVEINREGVTKGGSLAYLQQHLNITPEETAVFGDSANDLSMLPNGRFIAMANALPEVKAQAWSVTGNNNTDGIAQTVKQLLAE